MRRAHGNRAPGRGSFDVDGACGRGAVRHLRALLVCAGARGGEHRELQRKPAHGLVSGRGVDNAAAGERRNLGPAVVGERRRQRVCPAAARGRHAAGRDREEQSLWAGSGHGRTEVVQTAQPRQPVEPGGHRLRGSDALHRSDGHSGDRPEHQHRLLHAQDLRVRHLGPGTLVHGRGQHGHGHRAAGLSGGTGRHRPELLQQDLLRDR